VKPETKVFQCCAGPRKVACLSIAGPYSSWNENTKQKEMMFRNGEDQTKHGWSSYRVPCLKGVMRQWTSRRSSASRQERPDVGLTWQRAAACDMSIRIN
jgi:hypothetical protein